MQFDVVDHCSHRVLHSISTGMFIRLDMFYALSKLSNSCEVAKSALNKADTIDPGGPSHRIGSPNFKMQEGLYSVGTFIRFATSFDGSVGKIGK